MKKRVLIVSLAINLIFLLGTFYAIYTKGGLAFIKTKLGVNEGSKFTPHYYERKSLFSLLPKDTSDIIFLGNSIIEGCEWTELFQNPRIKNRGIGGDDTEGVLNRLDDIVVSKPQKIFLLIGINDFSKGRKEKDILINYDRILNIIKSKSSGTIVYIQSILPVDDKKNKTAKNVDIMSLNQGLVKLSMQYGFTYIDLYSLFIKGGDLDSTMSNDGVHLMGSGYLKWKDAIIQYLN